MEGYTEKTVVVTSTKTIRVLIKDTSLTPEAMEEFCKCFYQADANELFQMAAGHVSQLEGHRHIEGIGTCERIDLKRNDVPEDVLYEVVERDLEFQTL